MKSEVREKIHKLFTYSEASIEEICESFLKEITDKYNSQQNALNKLEATNQKLIAEVYKSEEIIALKHLAEEAQKEARKAKNDYYRGFPISEKEKEAIYNWRKNHDATEHSNPLQYHGVSGGGYAYTFVPTAIGTSGVCFCSICKNRALNAASKDGKFDAAVYSKYLKDHDGSFEFQEIG